MSGGPGVSRRRTERGAVTAELAMALPLLIVLTLGLVWLLSLGIAQVRVVDAARETARSLARDDPAQVAIGLGRETAPEGAHVDVRERDSTFEVEVSTTIAGPGGVFGQFAAVEVHARAVAAKEQP